MRGKWRKRTSNKNLVTFYSILLLFSTTQIVSHWNKATSGKNEYTMVGTGQTHLLSMAARKESKRDGLIRQWFHWLNSAGIYISNKSHSGAHEPVLSCSCLSKPLFAFGCQGSANTRLNFCQNEQEAGRGSAVFSLLWVENLPESCLIGFRNNSKKYRITFMGGTSN